MLKIRRSSNGGVEFSLIGEIDGQQVEELERLLRLEDEGGKISFNLREVTLPKTRKCLY